VVKVLKAAAKGIQESNLAADPDREGEAICQHLFEELSANPKYFPRLFHEITKNSHTGAFKNRAHQPQKWMRKLTRASSIDCRLQNQSIALGQGGARALGRTRADVALRMMSKGAEIRAFKSEEYGVDAATAAGVPPDSSRSQEPGRKEWSVAAGGAVSEIVEELRERFVVQ
jgi:DNA topoisomerase-1